MASNSNASASSFGWDFQRNAAILLMLKNIETAEKMKVEGNTEDIEITLKNGKVIYSQAKSWESPDSANNLIAKLKDAMRTLNTANNQPNVEKLIYITNHSNPFNNKNTMHFFGGQYTNLDYSELPEACKKKLEKIIQEEGYSIDTSKLQINVLQFYGNKQDNRYKVIKEVVQEFLTSLGTPPQYTAKKLLELWQKDCFFNSTVPDDAIKITKKSMMWGLIADICDFDANDPDDEVLSECDDALVQEINRHYRAVINNETENFSFITKVLSDYDEFKNKNNNLTTKEIIKLFISQCYSNYNDNFSIENIGEETKTCLIKIILKKIIDKRFTIDKIKKGAFL